MKTTIWVLIAFTIGYMIFMGGIDSHFWMPFILIALVSSGIGKIKLWKDGKKSEKIKKIVGIKT